MKNLRKAVHEACYDKAYAIAASGNKNKHERMDAFEAIREEFKAQFSEEELDEKGSIDRPLLPRCRKRSYAPLLFLTKVSVWTVVRLPKSARSGVK